MSKKRKKKVRQKRNKKSFLCTCILIAAVVIAGAVIIFTMVQEKKSEQIVDGELQENKEVNGLTFPFQVDDSKLEIASVFSYSGMNPDCNDESAEKVGAIQLSNNSDNYLESADITVVLANDEELAFRVEDIPAGQTVMAFDIENQPYNDETVMEIYADTQYAEESSLHEDRLSVTADENGITVTNQTEEQISGISVRYHCILDGAYWGGKCYQDTIEMLAPEDSVLLDAEECYFGEAAVVNIIMD